MGFLRFFGLAGVLLAGGCQFGPTVATQKLARHQADLEKDGLKTVEPVAALKITAAPPADWKALPIYKGALYTHEQWRSPSHATGVGVIYARLPMPMPVDMLLWFAKQQYTKKETDGKLIGQWTDRFGRSWFEAENNKYHVKGYAVVQGTDAWFVYSGYRTTMNERPEEITLAQRCQESVLMQSKKPAADSGTAQADIRN
jgi:hypothetical protein